MGRKYKDYHRITENGIEEKQCIDCQQWFEMNKVNFGLDKGNKDKLNMMCKTCQKKHNRIYYEHDQEKLKRDSRERGRKNKEKKNKQDLEYYYNNKDRYYDNCKRYKEDNQESVSIKEDEWTVKNRDKINGYSKDRNQHKTHKISDKEFQDCKEYFDNKCAYCNIDEQTHKKLYGQQLHKDHAYNNGSNNLTNCVPGCKSCNAKKREVDFNIWYSPDNRRFKEGFYKQENYDRIVKWLKEDCFQYLDPKHKD